ncbi:amino acid racemase [Pseudoflavonifractor sp. 524-17]|uniref:amino acid racemase n=1 Tax=Pseudoflavonifractor sp. 524-17 TaxID=2304577 RepID=UPI00137A245D|nr:amino acid racemase [Pseudoflavonifractor sp. 524-17]NCE63650.1 amino acid racemase [Pseudoflavonifractor sp. 524-17]
MKILAQRLKTIRRQRKIRQEVVAEALGLAVTTYRRYEGDQREPMAPTIAAMADYFQVSADYLLGRTDRMEGAMAEKKEARLGILGGMGPQATQIFYQRILDMTDAATDQAHVPTLIFSDTKMPDRTTAILGGDAEACYQRLRFGAGLLAEGGCTVLAIPCNTSHYFADRLQGDVPELKLVHMVRETVGVLAKSGRKRVGILATDGTVGTGIYQKECEAAGLECPPLPKSVQALVMSIIYDEIKRGEKGSREKFAEIDRCLRTKLNCDGAVLGCTELSVYRAWHGLPEYYLDAMDVLAQRAISACGYPLRLV